MGIIGCSISSVQDEMNVGHTQDDRLVAFFDIDNTLYSANSQIAKAVGVRILAYMTSLGLSDEKASELKSHYYTQYGLTVRGLRRHYGIDPLDFDEKCDGSLPLEEMLEPNPHVRQLLMDIDRSKCRVWALTNAYRTHAERVLSILGLRDQIEGLVFCDYQEEDFTCKPEAAFYRKAMQQAGVKDLRKCLFVDDSRSNVEGAKRFGWTRCVHFREVELATVGALTANYMAGNREEPPSEDGIPVIEDLQQLREVWPDIFVQPED